VYQYSNEQVQLKQSSGPLTMAVTSTNEKVVGARGTVRFDGKTRVVVFDGSVWREK
jgi:hypothetical protein